MAVAHAVMDVDDDNRHVGNNTFLSRTTFCANGHSTGERVNDDYQLMPGIQLDSVRSFNRPQDGDIRVTPIIVDFHNLLQSNTGLEIVKGVS